MVLIAKRLPEATWDILEISDYFDDRSETAGCRFRQSLEKTIQMLCKNPEFGEVLRYDKSKTIRYRTMIDFSNYVIFYCVERDSLVVVRVLHGSRNYVSLF